MRQLEEIAQTKKDLGKEMRSITKPSEMTSLYEQCFLNPHSYIKTNIDDPQRVKLMVQVHMYQEMLKLDEKSARMWMDAVPELRKLYNQLHKN